MGLGSLTPLAGGASEPRCTHTVAILGDAGAPILTGAGVGAVGSPEALRTGQVAAGAFGREQKSKPGLGPCVPWGLFWAHLPWDESPTSTVSLGHLGCSPIHPAWHWQCP